MRSAKKQDVRKRCSQIVKSVRLNRGEEEQLTGREGGVVRLRSRQRTCKQLRRLLAEK